ncbi:class I SAM-dependent methyltransferase [Halococcus sp. AFM35]|uniref:class I SAM-dependent methyltransferase n=1 Tax=Halococcus sp. AFM35 TaxID=3421653 RepID=UPI003EB84EC9
MNRFQNTRQPDRGWWSQLWPDPEQTLEMLGIEPDTSLADVGCGDGYFTLPAARLVNEAPVYAIDIDEELLEAVDTAAATERLANIETICGDARRLVDLLPELVDCILIANTFHGVENQLDLAEQAYRALRPAGRFVIVNWHDVPREETTVAGTERGPPETLRMSRADTRKVLDSASFDRIEEIDLPPYHYALVGHRQ